MVHHFVFVHGASHGGWCWYKLSGMLQSAGHKATSIDLEGAGISMTDPNTVLTLDHYNQPLYTFLSELPEGEKVILVGHSIGGGSVTAAMCKFTNKISMAVYVAAAMIQPGVLNKSNFLNIRLGHGFNANEFDYIYGQGTDQPPTGIIMKPQYVRQKYYNQSPFEDVVLASALLRPAPARAFEEIASLPPAPAVDGIPRVYVKTMKDHMFCPMMQDLFLTMWRPAKEYVLDGSDHSAFFSAPESLYACLIDAVSFI